MAEELWCCKSKPEMISGLYFLKGQALVTLYHLSGSFVVDGRFGIDFKPSKVEHNLWLNTKHEPFANESKY